MKGIRRSLFWFGIVLMLVSLLTTLYVVEEKWPWHNWGLSLLSFSAILWLFPQTRQTLKSKLYDDPDVGQIKGFRAVLMAVGEIFAILLLAGFIFALLF